MLLKQASRVTWDQPLLQIFGSQPQFLTILLDSPAIIWLFPKVIVTAIHNKRQEKFSELYVKTNLSLWPTIINRASPRNYLHDKYTETINITLLIQHSSASIFWSNITRKPNKIRFSFPTQENYKSTNHCLNELSYVMFALQMIFFTTEK